MWSHNSHGNFVPPPLSSRTSLFTDPSICSSFAFPLFPLVLFPMLCGYHFNTTLGQRNLSDSWTGFMIFMKPTYALCGFYENCKAHFGSSHSITMVFLHTLKPLGQGALPDLDCARLHLVQVLIPVKPLPYGFTYHFLHFNCNIYHFFHTSWYC